MWRSAWRASASVITGCAAAIVLGVMLGRIKLVNDLLDPVIELLRYLSPTAMIPIAVIWFGIARPQSTSSSSGARSLSC